MKDLIYDSSTAAECSMLIENIVNDHLMICRDINTSLITSTEAWHGDTGDRFREKSEALRTYMRMTEMMLNELKDLISEKSAAMRTLENNVFRKLISTEDTQ
jgi:uncharacterized protein YukE